MESLESKNVKEKKKRDAKFLEEELSSRPAVFSSCAHIPKTHFDTSLVRITCYGYEIRRHKQQKVKPFLKKKSCFYPF